MLFLNCLHNSIPLIPGTIQSNSRAIYGTTEPFARVGMPPRGLGGDAAILGPLFAADTGLMKKVLRGQMGAVVASVDQKTPADKTQFEAQKSQQRQAILQRRQNQIFQSWLTDLRRSAQISDYRSGFYD